MYQDTAKLIAWGTPLAIIMGGRAAAQHFQHPSDSPPAVVRPANTPARDSEPCAPAYPEAIIGGGFTAEAGRTIVRCAQPQEQAPRLGVLALATVTQSIR